MFRSPLLLAALSGNLADIDDAELAGHLARLAELVDEVSAGDVDATVLETLTSAADVAESVATELDCRATAEAERHARRTRLLKIGGTIASAALFGHFANARRTPGPGYTMR